MSNDQMQTGEEGASFISRVFTNDATRKGLAAAVAGILVATVCEAIWPST